MAAQVPEPADRKNASLAFCVSRTILMSVFVFLSLCSIPDMFLRFPLLRRRNPLSKEGVEPSLRANMTTVGRIAVWLRLLNGGSVISLALILLHEGGQAPHSFELMLIGHKGSFGHTWYIHKAFLFLVCIKTAQKQNKTNGSS